MESSSPLAEITVALLPLLRSTVACGSPPPPLFSSSVPRRIVRPVAAAAAPPFVGPKTLLFS